MDLKKILEDMDAAGWEDSSTKKAAAEIYRRVEPYAKAQEYWALQSIKQKAIDGYRSVWKEHLRAKNGGNVAIEVDGNVESAHSTYSMQEHDDSGAPIPREYKTKKWIKLPWPELDELIDTLETKITQITYNLAPMKSIRGLSEAYPEAKTPEELCEQAGIAISSLGGDDDEEEEDEDDDDGATL